MNIKVVKKEIKKEKTKWEGKIFLSNNSVIHFEMDKENNWQQWGTTKEELWITTPLIEELWNEFASR